MKKIAAFLTATIIFLATVFSVHFLAIRSMNSSNDEFGRWINTKKDLSYQAIASNMNERTYLMMGSSEFHHGKNKNYHPTQIFRETDMDVMCIGAAKNQCLSHALTLAAVGPELKAKKVAILLSPSWFSKEGIDKTSFTARFSESCYMAMLENKNLSEELRQKLIDRTGEVLDTKMSVYENIQRGNRVKAKAEMSLKDYLSSKLHKTVLNERELVSTGVLWAEHKNKTDNMKGKGTEPDWRKLEEEAQESFLKKADNQFYIKDSLYVSKVLPMMKERKGEDVNRTYGDSPEYGDLELFLEVCREMNIEADLILLPVNGYWYDYTGFPKENREIIVDKVDTIAKKYGAQFCSLFGECYTPGFLEDIVHPAGKGWIRINEEVHRFFNEA